MCCWCLHRHLLWHCFRILSFVIIYLILSFQTVQANNEPNSSQISNIQAKTEHISVCVSNIYDKISVKMSKRILQAKKEHISVYLSNIFDQTWSNISQNVKKNIAGKEGAHISVFVKYIWPNMIKCQSKCQIWYCRQRRSTYQCICQICLTKYDQFH